MLEHAFEVAVQRVADMGPIAEATDGAGAFIGSGDGTVFGRLDGMLRWTLYEHPGELACLMHHVLVIDTRDRARITVLARGHAQRRSADDSLWRITAALRFETDDDRYRWLGDTLGAWEGEFDAGTAHARYRGYLQSH